MNKKALLIIVFALLVVGVYFLINWFQSSSQKIAPSPTTPIVTLSPTPQKDTLRVTSVSPKEDVLTKRLPVQEIAFEFNHPIDPGKFLYSTSPNTQTEGREGGNASIIIISPKTMWTEGVTTIKILKGTKSIDGFSLLTDFTYRLNTAFPENPHEGDY